MLENNSAYKILTYQDVSTIASGENNELLVDVRKYDPSLISKYEKLDMIPYTGDSIFVRDNVAKKLAVANVTLSAKKLRLKVTYGYRHPEVQNQYFTRRRFELREQYPDLSDSELDTLTHNFVAVPDVAGHPTGGAVDILLISEDGDSLEFGTEIADYSDTEKMKTFGVGLSRMQIENRKILHDAMTQEGFAPFYGEWWHFSYGDREWAFFYKKPAALYGPIEFKI